MCRLSGLCLQTPDTSHLTPECTFTFYIYYSAEGGHPRKRTIAFNIRYLIFIIPPKAAIAFCVNFANREIYGIMKKSNIILLIVMAVAIGVIISLVGDFSTYETFATAAGKPGREFHVIGVLEKDKAMEYNPAKDANYFSFYVEDKTGNVRKVVFTGAKPTDFEKSEQIVLTGQMGEDDVFHCSKILMKCPSKYKEDQVAMSKEIQSKL